MTATRVVSRETPSTGERLSAAARAERSTALAMPGARVLLAMSVVMAVASTVANLATVPDLAAESSLQLAMHASTVATLMFAILTGVYSATTDFRFGVIDQRILSEPARWMVLVAKGLVALATGLLYGVLGALTAVPAAAVFYTLNDETFDVGSPLVRQALLGVVIGAPLFALLGVAIGMTVRNQPIAIGGSLAWLLIVEPVMIIGVPEVGRWLPGSAGISLTSAPDALLDQVPAGLFLSAVTLAAVAFSIVRFRQADL